MDAAEHGQFETPMQCGHYRLELPIRLATNRADAIHFACAFCGSRYAGFWLERISDDLKRHVRVDDEPRLG